MDRQAARAQERSSKAAKRSKAVSDFPLHAAVKQANAIEIRKLLASGADINAAKKPIGTPLHLAANLGVAYVVEALLDGGADISSQASQDRGTPLHYAIFCNHDSIVRMLLEAGANVNAKDKDGYTPLITALRTAAHMEIIEELFAHNCDIHARSNNGLTALHWAVVEDADHRFTNAVPRRLLFLLARGPELDAQGSDGSTALHIAAQRRSVRVLDELLDAGARVDIASKDCKLPIDIAKHASWGPAPHPYIIHRLIIFARADPPHSLMNEHGPNFVSKVLDRVVSLRERVVRSSSASIELMKSLHPSLRDLLRISCIKLLSFMATPMPYCCSERESARNLMNYLAIRREDLRELQLCLHELGLSTLGTVESHTLRTIDAVVAALSALSHRPASLTPHASLTFHEACRIMEEHTARLLGPRPARRAVRVMLTLDPTIVRNDTDVMPLLKAGVNCARINTAHNSLADWKAAIEKVRSASEKLNQRCVITVDLEGPKIRVGEMGSEDGMLKIKRSKSSKGESKDLAVIRFTTAPNSPTTLTSSYATSTVTVPLASPLRGVANGTVLVMRTFRNKHDGYFRVLESNEQEVLVASESTVVLHTGAPIWEKKGRLWNSIGSLQQKPRRLPIKEGDKILVCSDESTGGPADSKYALPHISVLPGWLLQHVKQGECIKFDDGRIEAVVQERTPQGLVIQILRAAQLQPKLRADMGVNFPQSKLPLPAVGEDDTENIKKLAPLVDAFSLSFVHQPEEIYLVQRTLAEVHRENVGIILKIETAEAFARLPELLLAAMQGPTVGVMIARGDLAVEVGWHRLAELQEEILWLSQAAHVPVIWATQVLENLSKLGIPSRAEVSDVVMAGRAECVMLNKGKYVLNTVSMLDEILGRMAEHQFQRMSLLRPLNVAKIFTLPEAKLREECGDARSVPKAKL